MKIKNKEIGPSSPAYFIAEIGSNFDGSIERAKNLIELAAESGADGVKFQHYSAQTLVSDIGFKSLDRGVVTHQSSWKGSVSEVYDKASLNLEWTRELFETAEANGLAFITTPYSLELLDYVAPYLDAIKIGSGDITYHKLIQKVASKGKPVLMAAGASTFHEVELAMNLFGQNANNVCLMQCNTNYEGNRENAKYQNLNVLRTFNKKFPDSLLGLSCHMQGATSAVASVVLGARIIEKHFTDDKSRPGPDHAFAMDPTDWKLMVNEVRYAEAMLGKTEKIVEENEKGTVVVQQRSLRASKNLRVGTIVSEEDIVVLRPCPMNSYKPFEIDNITGLKLTKDIAKGECFYRYHFNGEEN